FQSSTTSGSACLMSARTRVSSLPRQSSSSWTLASNSSSKLSPLVGFLFMPPPLRVGVRRYKWSAPGPSGPAGGLDAELLRVLGVQALPALEAHGLRADHASDGLTREQPIHHVEADVPAGRAHRDEAAIDVVPEREARA